LILLIITSGWEILHSVNLSAKDAEEQVFKYNLELRTKSI